MVRQAPVICVMAPPIHLGAWSMAMAAVLVIIIIHTKFAAMGKRLLRFDQRKNHEQLKYAPKCLTVSVPLSNSVMAFRVSLPLRYSSLYTTSPATDIRQRGDTSDNPSVAEFQKITQALRVINSFCRGPVRGNCRVCVRRG